MDEQSMIRLAKEQLKNELELERKRMAEIRDDDAAYTQAKEVRTVSAGGSDVPHRGSDVPHRSPSPKRTVRCSSGPADAMDASEWRHVSLSSQDAQQQPVINQSVKPALDMFASEAPEERRYVGRQVSSNERQVSSNERHAERQVSSNGRRDEQRDDRRDEQHEASSSNDRHSSSRHSPDRRHRRSRSPRNSGRRRSPDHHSAYRHSHGRRSPSPDHKRRRSGRSDSDRHSYHSSRRTPSPERQRRRSRSPDERGHRSHRSTSRPRRDSRSSPGGGRSRQKSWTPSPPKHRSSSPSKRKSWSPSPPRRDRSPSTHKQNSPSPASIPTGLARFKARSRSPRRDSVSDTASQARPSMERFSQDDRYDARAQPIQPSAAACYDQMQVQNPGQQQPGQPMQFNQDEFYSDPYGMPETGEHEQESIPRFTMASNLVSLTTTEQDATQQDTESNGERAGSPDVNIYANLFSSKETSAIPGLDLISDDTEESTTNRLDMPFLLPSSAKLPVSHSPGGPATSTLSQAPTTQHYDALITQHSGGVAGPDTLSSAQASYSSAYPAAQQPASVASPAISAAHMPWADFTVDLMQEALNRRAAASQHTQPPSYSQHNALPAYTQAAEAYTQQAIHSHSSAAHTMPHPAQAIQHRPISSQNEAAPRRQDHATFLPSSPDYAVPRSASIDSRSAFLHHAEVSSTAEPDSSTMITAASPEFETPVVLEPVEVEFVDPMGCPVKGCDSTVYTKLEDYETHWTSIHNTLQEHFNCYFCSKSDVSAKASFYSLFGNQRQHVAQKHQVFLSPTYTSSPESFSKVGAVSKTINKLYVNPVHFYFDAFTSFKNENLTPDSEIGSLEPPPCTYTRPVVAAPPRPLGTQKVMFRRAMLCPVERCSATKPFHVLDEFIQHWNETHQIECAYYTCLVCRNNPITPRRCTLKKIESMKQHFSLEHSNVPWLERKRKQHPHDYNPAHACYEMSKNNGYIDPINHVFMLGDSKLKETRDLVGRTCKCDKTQCVPDSTTEPESAQENLRFPSTYNQKEKALYTTVPYGYCFKYHTKYAINTVVNKCQDSHCAFRHDCPNCGYLHPMQDCTESVPEGKELQSFQVIDFKPGMHCPVTGCSSKAPFWARHDYQWHWTQMHSPHYVSECVLCKWACADNSMEIHYRQKHPDELLYWNTGFSKLYRPIIRPDNYRF